MLGLPYILHKLPSLVIWWSCYLVWCCCGRFMGYYYKCFVQTFLVYFHKSWDSPVLFSTSHHHSLFATTSICCWVPLCFVCPMHACLHYVHSKKELDILISIESYLSVKFPHPLYSFLMVFPFCFHLVFPLASACASCVLFLVMKTQVSIVILWIFQSTVYLFTFLISLTRHIILLLAQQCFAS